MYIEPIPPQKIKLLTPVKPDEMMFEQGGFKLIVTYYRKLTSQEAALIQETVCKQLSQRRLAANLRLPVSEGDFQVGLKLLVDSLERLSAP